jgi:hypothetical protein
MMVYLVMDGEQVRRVREQKGMSQRPLAAANYAWTVAVPAQQATFRVTINGFKVNNETFDHQLEVDGKGGNDTYTNFVRGNSGVDDIYDSGGKDKLVLTAYSRSEILKRATPVDYLTKNGKVDGLEAAPIGE